MRRRGHKLLAGLMLDIFQDVLVIEKCQVFNSYSDLRSLSFHKTRTH